MPNLCHIHVDSEKMTHLKFIQDLKSLFIESSRLDFLPWLDMKDPNIEILKLKNSLWKLQGFTVISYVYHLPKITSQTFNSTPSALLSIFLLSNICIYLLLNDLLWMVILQHTY